MKRNFLIPLILSGCLFLGAEAIAQEDRLAVEEISQDDLGNVTDEFQEYFFEALKQKGIENYEKAITALRACAKLEPGKAVVYFEMAKNYRAMEDYDNAIISLKKALDLEPQRLSILKEMYGTYRDAGDFGNAIAILKRLDQKDYEYSQELANLYMLNGQYDEALQLLDELDRKLGSNTYRTTMRRQIYARTNNTDAQIEKLLEDIAAHPENEQNYLNLIYIYSEQKAYEKAFNTAQQLLKVDPGSKLVHLALYKFYLEKGNPEEAVKSMKIVFESEEIDTESKYKVLNDFLMFVNEHPEYQGDLMEVSRELSEWEDTPELYEQLGKYYLKNNKKEAALRYFELGLKETPDNFELLKNTLLLQLEYGKLAEADKLSQEATEMFPAQPLVYLLRGIILNKLQKYSEAEEILTFGLDFLIDDKKTEVDFYAQLAISYRGQHKEEKALEFQQKADRLVNELN